MIVGVCSVVVVGEVIVGVVVVGVVVIGVAVSRSSSGTQSRHVDDLLT